MQASERSDDVLYFLCEGCGSELSVPVALHGIDGPCPCCGQILRAPELVLPPLPPVVVSLPPFDRRHELWQNTEPVPVPGGANWDHASVEDWESAVGEAESSYVLPAPGKDRLRVSKDDPYARGPGFSGAGGFQAKLTISSLIEAPEDATQAPTGVSREGAALGRTAGQWSLVPAFRLARVALLVSTGGLCAALVLFLKDRQWVLDLPWQPDREESMSVLPPVTAPPVPFPLEPQDTTHLPNPFLAEDPSELEQVSRPVVAAPVPDAAATSGSPLPIASGKK